MVQEPTLEWHVIPEPTNVEPLVGTCALPLSGTVVEQRGADDAEAVFARQLVDDIKCVCGGRWQVASGEVQREVTLRTSPSLGDWSYVLEVSPDGVVITGSGFEGVRDGVQTLRQIICQIGLTIRR